MKIKGTLTGCSGTPFTGATYTATLRTAGPVSCSVLTGAGETATGAAKYKWTPKAKASTGTLSMPLTETPEIAFSGEVTSGSYAPLTLTGTATESYTGGATCGEKVGKKASESSQEGHVQRRHQRYQPLSSVSFLNRPRRRPARCLMPPRRGAPPATRRPLAQRVCDHPDTGGTARPARREAKPPPERSKARSGRVGHALRGKALRRPRVVPGRSTRRASRAAPTTTAHQEFSFSPKAGAWLAGAHAPGSDDFRSPGSKEPTRLLSHGRCGSSAELPPRRLRVVLSARLLGCRVASHNCCK